MHDFFRSTAIAAASVALTAISAVPSAAAVLLEETFDYNTGALAGSNGGTGFSDA